MTRIRVPVKLPDAQFTAATQQNAPALQAPILAAQDTTALIAADSSANRQRVHLTTIAINPKLARTGNAWILAIRTRVPVKLPDAQFTVTTQQNAPALQAPILAAQDTTALIAADSSANRQRVHLTTIAINPKLARTGNAWILAIRTRVPVKLPDAQFTVTTQQNAPALQAPILAAQDTTALIAADSSANRQRVHLTTIAINPKLARTGNAWILAIRTRVPANSHAAAAAVTVLNVIAHQPVVRPDTFATVRAAK